MVTSGVEPRVDCEMVTKYSPIFALVSISLIYAIMTIEHNFSIL